MMIELEDHSVLHHMPAPPQQEHIMGKDVENKSLEDSAQEIQSTYSPQKQVDEFKQLSLFAEEPAYLEELRQLKINAMTPLDALNYLDQLIKKVQSSGN